MRAEHAREAPDSGSGGSRFESWRASQIPLTIRPFRGTLRQVPAGRGRVRGCCRRRYGAVNPARGTGCRGPQTVGARGIPPSCLTQARWSGSCARPSPGSTLTRLDGSSEGRRRRRPSRPPDARARVSTRRRSSNRYSGVRRAWLVALAQYATGSATPTAKAEPLRSLPRDTQPLP